MARRDDLQDQLDAVARVGNLFGLTVEPVALPAFDIVGWAQPVPGTCKGSRHLCIRCQDRKPVALGGPWDQVQRSQLAAAAPCSLCGVPLERLDLTVRHDCDEGCSGCSDCYQRHGHTVCSSLCIHSDLYADDGGD